MTSRKIGLYLISISMLFIFIIIIKIDISIFFSINYNFTGLGELIKKNIIPIICILLLIISFIAYKKFKYDLQGSTHIPFKITKIEGVNYEHLTFLATYVIPLISFDFDSERYLVVLGALLIIMGIIYVKTDLFYANPSLALLGFRIYKVNGSFKNNETRNDIIILSRSKIKLNDKVSYIKLDDRIYYAERNYNEQK